MTILVICFLYQRIHLLSAIGSLKVVEELDFLLYIEYQKGIDLGIFTKACESLFIEIDKTVFNSDKNIIIGVIYRPPNTDMQRFFDILKNLMEIFKHEDKICYLIGDYNINLLNVDSQNLTGGFIDFIYSSGFIPLIIRPTTVSESFASLKDNIFSNQLLSTGPELDGILLTDISDHYPIFHINEFIKSKDTDVPISRRNYSAKYKNTFMPLLR